MLKVVEQQVMDLANRVSSTAATTPAAPPTRQTGNNRTQSTGRSVGLAATQPRALLSDLERAAAYFSNTAMAATPRAGSAYTSRASQRATEPGPFTTGSRAHTYGPSDPLEAFFGSRRMPESHNDGQTPARVGSTLLDGLLGAVAPDSDEAATQPRPLALSETMRRMFAQSEAEATVGGVAGGVEPIDSAGLSSTGPAGDRRFASDGPLWMSESGRQAAAGVAATTSSLGALRAGGQQYAARPGTAEEQSFLSELSDGPAATGTDQATYKLEPHHRGKTMAAPASPSHESHVKGGQPDAGPGRQQEGHRRLETPLGGTIRDPLYNTPPSWQQPGLYWGNSAAAGTDFGFGAGGQAAEHGDFGHRQQGFRTLGSAVKNAQETAAKASPTTPHTADGEHRMGLQRFMEWRT